MVYAILYLLLCIIAGYLGKESRLGFWGVAVVGALLTPIVALFFVILFGRRGSLT
jgi:hypothetical protein